jgi:hypothetical protein
MILIDDILITPSFTVLPSVRPIRLEFDVKCVSKRLIRIHSQICQDGEGWKKAVKRMKQTTGDGCGGDKRKEIKLKFPSPSQSNNCFQEQDRKEELNYLENVNIEGGTSNESLFSGCTSSILKDGLDAIWYFSKLIYDQQFRLEGNNHDVYHPYTHTLYSGFPYSRSLSLATVIDIISRRHTLQPCALEIVCADGESQFIIFPTPEV